MAITNSVPLDGSNSLWDVSGHRDGYSISYALALTDNDRQTTAAERDAVALAVGQALTSAGFTVTVARADVVSTPLT